jgi:hypothetical protein
VLEEQDPQLERLCRYGLFLAVFLHCLMWLLYLMSQAPPVQHVSNFA